MKELVNKLGKLSIAILENFVEDKLGKKFTEELRAPTDRALAIGTALEHVEERFLEEYPDKDLAHAIFVDLPPEKILLGKTLGKFFDHPTDSDFPQTLTGVLIFHFKHLTPESINSAVNFYIKLLKQEFAIADETFREKIVVLTHLEALEYLKESSHNDKKTPHENHANLISSPYPELNLDELPPPSDSLPKGYRIPFNRNRAFTNRKAELISLAKNLLAESTNSLATRMAMVTGIGGIGKTQLAVEFCYRYGKYFDGVHWINTDQAIDSEIAACGREMGLRNFSDDTREQVFHTLNAWQDKPNRLVILDNVVKPELLRDWLPKLNGFRILISSRSEIWSADFGVDIHSLEELPPYESLLLLRKLATPKLEDVPDEKLLQIADRLGNLPLALDLAGRYFKGKQDLTPETYIQMLDNAENALEHLSLQTNFLEDGSPTKHKTSLKATFMLSWEQLDEHVDELTRRLFISAGYLAPNTSISVDIFYALANAETDENLQNIVDQSIMRLQALGLLSDKLALHPLLALFAKTQASDSLILEILVNKIVRLSNEAIDTGLPSRLSFIIPHMENLAATAQETHLNTSALWSNLGEYYQMVAKYSEAKTAYENAINKEMNNNSNQNDSIIANLTLKIGRVFQDLSDFENAKDNYLQAFKIWKKTFDDHHPGAAIILNYLADAQKETGNLKIARRNAKHALKIDTQNYGEAHPDVARDQHSLGKILEQLGQWNDAKTLFESALKIDMNYDHEHRAVARDLNSLGEILLKQGILNDAKQYFQHAIEINEKWFGKDHPQIAFSMRNMGDVLMEEKDLVAAKEYYKRAHKMFLKFFPPNYPSVQQLDRIIGAL